MQKIDLRSSNFSWMIQNEGGVGPHRFEEMFSNHMNLLSHCSCVCLK